MYIFNDNKCFQRCLHSHERQIEIGHIVSWIFDNIVYDHRGYDRDHYDKRTEDSQGPMFMRQLLCTRIYVTVYPVGI